MAANQTAKNRGSGTTTEDLNVEMAIFHAYGEGVAEPKAKEARLAAEEWLPDLRRSSYIDSRSSWYDLL
jgi:hypothetical protein